MSYMTNQNYYTVSFQKTMANIPNIAVGDGAGSNPTPHPTPIPGNSSFLPSKPWNIK